MKPRIRVLITAVLCYIVLFNYCSAAGKRTSKKLDRVKFDSEISRIMNEYKMAGLSMTAVRDGRVVLSAHYGYSDLIRKIRAGKKTKYRIASISKMITGVALMQLYEKGLIGLDDDISKHLLFRVRNPRHPKLPVTVRHLLTHTSGIVDEAVRYEKFLEASYGPEPPPMSEMITPGGKYYSENIWSKFKPGKKFQYSNLASGIIASIVERTSGEWFPDYCARHIFRPLGMDASFEASDISDANDISVLYDYDSDLECYEALKDNFFGISPGRPDYSRYEPGYNGLMYSPQGGVRASTDDMAKFMMALLNNGKYESARVLNKNTAKLMRKQHWSGFERKGFFKKMGLFTHITDDLVPGRTLTGHRGRAYGLLGLMYFSRKDRFGAVILMNGGDYIDRVPDHFNQVEKRLYNLLYRQFAD
jgi:CubicO group peptidase (beta-lactamase class C family)